jgi:hypothetical protein
MTILTGSLVRRGALAAGLISALVMPGPAPVLAGGVTCSFDNASGILSVSVTQNERADLSRTASGRIKHGSASCIDSGGTPATVRNTERIDVTGTSGAEQVSLDLHHGGFRPGRVDEPGNSDEIEIALSLGGQFNDFLDIIGGDSAAGDNIRLGCCAGSLIVPLINLDAAETTGVDADVTFQGGVVGADLGPGDDTLSGAGGAGTGTAFPVPMMDNGGAGRDRLVGGLGADGLEGGSGPDTLIGGKDADSLVATDGVAGNDVSRGGSGDDFCQSDPGDLQASCEH